MFLDHYQNNNPDRVKLPKLQPPSGVGL